MRGPEGEDVRKARDESRAGQQEGGGWGGRTVKSSSKQSGSVTRLRRRLRKRTGVLSPVSPT